MVLPLLAADTKDIALSIVLDGLENRYNRAKTLQVSFEESYMGSGRPRRSESGELSLLKPGKMRWEYSQSGRQSCFFPTASSSTTTTPYPSEPKR